MSDKQERIYGRLEKETDPNDKSLTEGMPAKSESIKIVVVSDTHMTRMAKSLPSKLVEELADADLILHAGDWTSAEVCDMLAEYAPVRGVAGNNDGSAIVKQWGYRRIIEIGSIRIGLTHGHLGRSGTAANALAAFEGEEVDIVIFGHSHIPLLSTEAKTASASGISLFNPGSPTDKRRLKQYSFGIITLNNGMPAFEHRYYDSKL